jgi:hypothetical protein
VGASLGCMTILARTILSSLSSYGLGVLLSPEGELFRALYLGLALLMVFPPTFMMGVSFYSLQNAVQNDISMG